MKISIGCDHAGFEVKEMIIKLLNNLEHDVLVCGTNSLDSVDYPVFGLRVGESLKNDEADRGIVVCGSGIGISIAANKIKGIRAALCTTVEHAVLSRQHNNANVLALGARLTDLQTQNRQLKAQYKETKDRNTKAQIVAQ